MPPRVAIRLIGGLCIGLLAGACRDAAEPEPIVLRLANWGSPAIESSFMALEREIWSEFEQQHPGVKLQIEQIPGVGQYVPKLIMMHVSGAMPDLIHLDASSAAVFINNHVLRDLTPFIARDPDFHLDDFFENVVNIARRDERLFAIPLDFTPMVMYYNKKLFDAAGVPYPQPGWTWEDFVDKARRLTILPPGAKRPTQYGFSFENEMPFWVPWLWTNGGDVVDPSGSKATGAFDSRESIAALEFINDLMLKQRYASSIADRLAEGVDLFLDGRAAMDMKGHWMMIDYRARGLDVGVIHYPMNGPRRPVTVVYEAGVAITAGSRHPDLAWEYIKFATSRDVQIRRLKSGLAISGNKHAAAYFAGNPVEDAFIENVEYARPPWGALVERYPACEDLGREMMKDIQYGGIPVDQAMHETAALMDAMLGQP